MKRAKGPATFCDSAYLRATLVVLALDQLDDDFLSDYMASYFHADERARLQALEHDKRKRSYATGRIAAKLALKSHHDGLDPREVSIGSGVFEQPVIGVTHPGIGETGISISHSASYAAALAFHRAHPMGIDIDLPAKKDIGPVLSGLASEERGLLDDLGLDESAAATLIWVARESLAKTLTTGMMTPLSIYAPSSIETDNGIFTLRYRNFAQYRTLVWQGLKGWLAVTLPERTALDVSSLPWS